MKAHSIATLILSVCILTTVAQNRTLDSLKKLPDSFVRDTLMCFELNNVMSKIETMEEFLPYNDKVIKICSEGLKRPGIKNSEWNFYIALWAKRIGNIAFIYSQEGKLKEALVKYLALRQVEKKYKDTSPPTKWAQRERSATLNNIAFLQYQLGEATTAARSYSESLEMIESYRSVDPLYTDQQKATVLNNLASLLQNVGDIPNALDIHNKSLALRISLNKEHPSAESEIFLAQSYNNLGKLYDELEHHDKGMEFYQKSLALIEKSQDQMGMATIYNNIAGVFAAKKDHAQAISYYEKSIALKKKIGDDAGLCQSYTNLASIFRKLNETAKAMDTYSLAITHALKSGSPEQTCYALTDLGLMQKQLGNLDEAERTGEKAFQISKSAGIPALSLQTSQLLYEVYTLKGKFKEAIAMNELNIKMSDSLTSGQNRKAIIQQEYKYAYEKKLLTDSVRTSEENKVFQAQIRSDKMQKNGLLVGISILILFSIFMYNRFRVINVQKKIIEQQSALVQEQKQIAEEKQREVLSSIRYAKKIQTALLPNEKQLNVIFNKRKNAG